MLQVAEVEALKGRHVVGSDGNKIGKVDEVYLDENSGSPEWALVNTGLFGLRSSFVLITGATEDGEDIVVPFDKATVKDAPSIDPDGALTPEEEATLFAHYGRDDYAAAPGGPTSDAVPAAQAAPGEDPAAAQDGPAGEDSGPSASLAAARLARESASGEGTVGTDGERTQADLDHERRGPEGPTGRSDTEDPVPPDGEAPPRVDHVMEPTGAPDGVEGPSAVEQQVPKPAGAPETEEHRGEHWEEQALPEHGNATALPEEGPAAEPHEQDGLEAPETGDVPAPQGGGSDTGRARLRKYVADGSADAVGPGAPHPKHDR
jgi:sporulation protein YlmC with PRC-barrel domain